jgi:hypothetical protein
VAINQEDLLATMLTFSIGIFEALERFGIRWTIEEQDAYLQTWDVVGHHLGIGTDAVLKQLVALAGSSNGQYPVPEGSSLRPTTVHDARLLLVALRERQWGSPPSGVPLTREWESLRAGRVLVEALLDELEAAMPRARRGWPLMVMRQLAPLAVRDRLAMGGVTDYLIFARSAWNIADIMILAGIALMLRAPKGDKKAGE